MIDSIIYNSETKSFGYASEYDKFRRSEKLTPKLEKANDKLNMALDKGEYLKHGNMLEKLRARNQFKKADKYQAKVNALQRRIDGTPRDSE